MLFASVNTPSALSQKKASPQTRMPNKKAMRKMIFLLGEELTIDIGHEGVLVEVTNRQCYLRCHDDMALVHLDNALQVNDIGTVRAHELVAGQTLFHLLHAQ